jgi:hypothetical protein
VTHAVVAIVSISNVLVLRNDTGIQVGQRALPRLKGARRAACHPLALTRGRLREPGTLVQVSLDLETRSIHYRLIRFAHVSHRSRLTWITHCAVPRLHECLMECFVSIFHIRFGVIALDFREFLHDLLRMVVHRATRVFILLGHHEHIFVGATLPNGPELRIISDKFFELFFIQSFESIFQQLLIDYLLLFE